MDHSWNTSRSSGGMPNSSAITIAGSGFVKSSIRSMRPRGIAVSSSSSTTRSITDCQRSSADGVKAWLPRNAQPVVVLAVLHDHHASANANVVGG